LLGRVSAMHLEPIQPLAPREKEEVSV
jgi:hypothetical protein